MREYGRIASTIWESADFRRLSEDGRWLVIYLLANRHANLTGCYFLPLTYASEDLQWACERVSKAFSELSASGFATRDEPSRWVLVHKFLAWNPFENPNVAKSAVKAFDLVKVESLKVLLAKAFLEFGAHLSEEFTNRLTTLVEQYRKPEPEPEPEPEPFLNQNPSQEIHAPAEAVTPPAKDPGALAPQPEEPPAPKPTKSIRASAIPAMVTVADLISEGVDPQHAQDWMRVRKDKKLTLTATAWAGFKADAAKLSVPVPMAVKVCARAGWGGCFDDTYKWQRHLDAGDADVIRAGRAQATESTPQGAQCVVERA
jgi:hypothetical protein